MAESNTPILKYPLNIIEDYTDYFLITPNVTRKSTSFNDPTSPNTSTFSKDAVIVTRGRYSRSTNRTNKSIILPIPSNIQDQNVTTFEDGTINGYAADVLSGAIKAMTNANDAPKTLSDAMTSALEDNNTKKVVNMFLGASAVNQLGANVTLNQLIARTSGQILNPNMELLFGGPTLRSFRFQFKLTPRSEDEGRMVKNIIRELKKAMAPKDLNGSNKLLGSPDAFNISYKTGNGDHKFLNSFKPCFLTNMAVNYTGENTYSTYGDGTPVSMLLDLTFKEIEPVYNTDYTDTLKGVGF